MEKYTAGQMICSYRERANLTQEELAAIINVTKGKLDHWEKDVTIPRPSMLARLADSLKLSDSETKMLITAIAEAKAKKELEQAAEQALLTAQNEEEIRLEHERKALKLFWMGTGGFVVGLLICFVSGAWRDFPWYGPIAIGIMIAGIPYGWTIDIPWLPNIATNGLLADITDLITTSHLETEHFLTENLENCQYDGRYYGIPVIGGTQMLLYRKDLFENPVLQNEFEKEYKVRLRPPVTWTEFNGICKFFTRSHNPKSPTPYGTAIGMSSREDLITYLFPYIWARGGEIFDSKDVLQVSSPANALAIEDFLQTLNYTDGNYANTSLVDTVEQFCNGDVAMLIVFTLNLSLQHIQKALGDKVGYALLPRKQSVLPGWNFGVSNFTDQHANIAKFFEWFSKKHISYYLTILTGESTVIAPYGNRQIRAMYPWLPLAAKGLKYGHLRTSFAHKSKWHAIPQDKIEDTIAQCIHDVLEQRMDVREALAEAEQRLNALYTSRKTKPTS